MRGGKVKRGNFIFPSFSLFFLLFPFFSFFFGCGPKYTYPSDTVPKSIGEICEKEHKLSVTARVTGKTAGAFMSVSDLVNAGGQMPQEAHERMGKVMQAVTRVALSTDLGIDFCTVVLRDQSHGVQLAITRSLDDTKRANADAIGIEESMHRTLFTQEYFDPEAADENPFVLKEIRREDFLQAQIVQRVRLGLAKDGLQDTRSSFALVDGSFEDAAGRRAFRFSIIGLKSAGPHESILVLLRTARDVFKGYAFTAFDALEIQDYLNRRKLTLDRQTFQDYVGGKVKEEEILRKHLTESQSIQEAFKLFGLNLSPDSAEEAVKTVPTP